MRVEGSKEGIYRVYSDDRRRKKPLFESTSASEALQWAIDKLCSCKK